jgi:hypothetical protein
LSPLTRADRGRENATARAERAAAGRVVRPPATRAPSSIVSGGAGLGESLVVWALYGIVTLEILVTYARLPAGDLYHVSGSGLGGGASRALVFLDFPVSLAAISLVALAADRLSNAFTTALACVSVALCAVTFWPGVVDEGDLDARTINALPAVGVLLALSLTLAAAARWGADFAPRRPADLARVALTAVLVFVSLPWLVAELGFSFDGVPVLSWIWQSGELRTQPGHRVPGPAVHHGHHHGMACLLLVVTALLLSRAVGLLRHPRLRLPLIGYLSLMLIYGLVNLANDAWLEQIVKRGWTNTEIPDLLVPSASLAWAVLVLLAAAVALLWFAGEAGKRPAWRRRGPRSGGQIS